MSVTLVVLAGGRAKRLGGVIKPLLVRPDGRTLLRGVVDALWPLAEAMQVVAPLEIVEHFPMEVVVDAGEGPARALLAAARAVEAPLILLAGGDQISPSRPLATRLIEAVSDRDAAAVQGQPLFAVFRTSALLALDDPPTSLKGCLARLDTAWVEATDDAAFCDVDTPEDLARHGLSVAGVPTW